MLNVARPMDLDTLLKSVVECGATDLHLKLGLPPIVRRDGHLGALEGYPPLTEADLETILLSVTSRTPHRLDAFRETGELDTSYMAPDLARFRVNGFKQRGTTSFAFRVIPTEVPGFDDLKLPTGVRRLAEEQRGLVLVTGATGSGKTTTLATIIDHINRTRRQHIVTIEDPIEILHADHGCIVNQREVGLDTDSFSQALRRALRQDPDVILIGELRDAETAETALQAAESGHLVFSTMHTVDAAETIGRIIEFFPGVKQQQIRSILAGVLRGVVSQRLLPRTPGARIGAFEVMVKNARIADLIRDDKADEIHDAIEEGAFFHMQTFSQALIAARRRRRDRPRDRCERRHEQARLPRRARARAQAQGRHRARGRRGGGGRGRARAAGRPPGRERMRRLLLSIAVLAALGGTGAAAGATGSVFTVVPSTTAAAPLASAEIPNSGLLLSPSYLAPQSSTGLPFPVLDSYWQEAGATYGIPWQVLAAINKVESNFGRNMGPSSAGAIGWMQFMPSTWQRWGMDANGDGIADPWNADGRDLRRRPLPGRGRRPTDISRGIFAYNHAQWYVDEVLALARLYGQNGVDVAFTYDRMHAQLQNAGQTVAAQNRIVVRATAQERRLASQATAMYAKADSTPLLSNRLALQKRAFQVDARRAAAGDEVATARRKLKEAAASLAKARASSWTSSFAPGAAAALATPMYQGDYVFPVGGGASIVSVGHTHHDYPAADIAAPEGSPLYALTAGFIVDAWHMPNGSCGIGLTMRAAADGREWTYCHMSYEEPGIQPGVAVSSGQSVGLVGHTGHATGPHLHLQLTPAVSYPQVESWFQGFAGSAFRWQDAPTMDVGPVFEIVDGGSAAPSDDPAVITFTAERP